MCHDSSALTSTITLSPHRKLGLPYSWILQQLCGRGLPTSRHGRNPGKLAEWTCKRYLQVTSTKPATNRMHQIAISIIENFCNILSNCYFHCSFDHNLRSVQKLKSSITSYLINTFQLVFYQVNYATIVDLNYSELKHRPTAHCERIKTNPWGQKLSRRLDLGTIMSQRDSYLECQSLMRASGTTTKSVAKYSEFNTKCSGFTSSP